MIWEVINMRVPKVADINREYGKAQKLPLPKVKKKKGELSIFDKILKALKK